MPELTPAQRESLSMLCSYDSHDALTREEAEQITRPFGFAPPVYREKVNVTPKGLWITGAKPGSIVERAGAWDVASAICSHLGLTYVPAFGRGTEYRRAIAAIEAHYGITL